MEPSRELPGRIPKRPGTTLSGKRTRQRRVQSPSQPCWYSSVASRISCQSHTIRSRNQRLPRYPTAAPNRTGQGSKTRTPQGDENNPGTGCRREDVRDGPVIHRHRYHITVHTSTKNPFIEISIRRPDGITRILEAKNYDFTAQERIIYGGIVRISPGGSRWKELSSRVRKNFRT